MLDSLDLVIGFSVVMLIFSLATTALIHTVTSVLQLRGRLLVGGLSSLLRQLGPSLDQKMALEIAWAVVRHPLVTRGKAQLGSVVSREELIHLLLGLAADLEPTKLNPKVLDALRTLLEQSGITQPEEVLRDIHAQDMHLEVAQPELAAHLRQAAVIVAEASSEFVARVFAWFDTTMDRISQQFATYARLIAVVVGLALAFTFQLDAVQVLNRLAIDKDLRKTVVASGQTLSEREGRDPTLEQSLQDLQGLVASKLITLPWEETSKDEPTHTKPQLIGMLLSALLIGLGAPFWFNLLKNVLSLRSSLATKDDEERAQRRAQQEPPSAATSAGAGEATSGDQSTISAVG